MKFTILALLTLAVPAFGQPANVQISVTRYNNFAFYGSIPGAPSSGSPYAVEGIGISIRTENPEVDCYRITLKYTDAAGIARTQVQTISRWQGWTWTYTLFSTGQGSKLTAVSVEELRTISASAFDVRE